MNSNQNFKTGGGAGIGREHRGRAALGERLTCRAGVHYFMRGELAWRDVRRVSVKRPKAGNLQQSGSGELRGWRVAHLVAQSLFALCMISGDSFFGATDQRRRG